MPTGPAVEPDWAAALGAPDARLHLYGKRDPRRARKMGHLTVVGDDPSAAAERALALRGRSPPADRRTRCGEQLT